MAVIAWKEAAAHATLTASQGGKREWSAPYILTVDDAKDDAKTCVDFMDTIGRGLSSTFRYGDRQDSYSFCKQITPTRMTGSVEHWQVICECSTLEPQDKEDDEGNPTEDPIDWRYDISCSTQLFQVPAWSGWNVDVMNGVPANTFGPIRNSANIVYDPPLMREIPETVLRISGNAWEFWAAILMVNAGSINQFEIAWSNLLCEKYGFVAQSFAPYCVHCTAVGADYRVENGYRFWKYTFEFHMRTPADSVNPQDGFLETILDRGITRAAGSGDPDGKGGIISPSDILEGMAPATAVRDIEDRRIPEMVLFDGKGQPLIDLTKPVYFRWRIHPFGAFNYIPLDIFK